MLDLVGWTAAGQWRGEQRATKPLAPFMNRRIDRLWLKIAGSSDVGGLDDDQRHHLRIRMKKLRYALEFAAALHKGKPRRRKKFMKTVKGLQESIGNLHDIVTARSLVTLNSWLAAPGSSPKREQRLVRDADRALRRLSKVGSYWA